MWLCSFPIDHVFLHEIHRTSCLLTEKLKKIAYWNIRLTGGSTISFFYLYDFAILHFLFLFTIFIYSNFVYMCLLCMCVYDCWIQFDIKIRDNHSLSSIPVCFFFFCCLPNEIFIFSVSFSSIWFIPSYGRKDFTFNSTSKHEKIVSFFSIEIVKLDQAIGMKALNERFDWRWNLSDEKS